MEIFDTMGKQLVRYADSVSANIAESCEEFVALSNDIEILHKKLNGYIAYVKSLKERDYYQFTNLLDHACIL